MAEAPTLLAHGEREAYFYGTRRGTDGGPVGTESIDGVELDATSRKPLQCSNRPCVARILPHRFTFVQNKRQRAAHRDRQLGYSFESSSP